MSDAPKFPYFSIEMKLYDTEGNLIVDGSHNKVFLPGVTRRVARIEHSTEDLLLYRVRSYCDATASNMVKLYKEKKGSFDVG